MGQHCNLNKWLVASCGCAEHLLSRTLQTCDQHRKIGAAHRTIDAEFSHVCRGCGCFGEVEPRPGTDSIKNHGVITRILVQHKNGKLRSIGPELNSLTAAILTLDLIYGEKIILKDGFFGDR